MTKQDIAKLMQHEDIPFTEAFETKLDEEHVEVVTEELLEELRFSIDQLCEILENTEREDLAEAVKNYITGHFVLSKLSKTQRFIVENC